MNLISNVRSIYCLTNNTIQVKLSSRIVLHPYIINSLISYAINTQAISFSISKYATNIHPKSCIQKSENGSENLKHFFRLIFKCHHESICNQATFTLESLHTLCTKAYVFVTACMVEKMRRVQLGAKEMSNH